MSDIIATYEQTIDDLETLLSELDGGYKVTITRKEPPWAEEQLGTIDFSPGEAISTDWIRNRYGGGSFSLRIKDANGKHKGHRAVRINERPKNRYGVEIYPGPDGVPITKDEQNSKPQPPAVDPMIIALKEIMQAQAQNARATQDLLLKRIESLERAVVSSNQNQNPVQAQHLQPYDPQSQLKTTLETMKMIEELKENVKGNDPDELDENPFFSKVMEKMLDKLTDDKQTAPAPPGSPPLPPRTEPNNLELAQMVKSRLAGMDPEERDYLMSTVFGDEEDDFEEIDEEPIDTGQEDNPDLDSLLSGEDQQQLKEAATNETPAPGNDSP